MKNLNNARKIRVNLEIISWYIKNNRKLSCVIIVVRKSRKWKSLRVAFWGNLLYPKHCHHTCGKPEKLLNSLLIFNLKFKFNQSYFFKFSIFPASPNKWQWLNHLKFAICAHLARKLFSICLCFSVNICTDCLSAHTHKLTIQRNVSI